MWCSPARHEEAHRELDAVEAAACDAAAAGAPDPYVYDELALLHRAAGDEKQALEAEARASTLRKK